MEHLDDMTLAKRDWEKRQINAKRTLEWANKTIDELTTKISEAYAELDRIKGLGLEYWQANARLNKYRWRLANVQIARIDAQEILEAGM